MRNTIVILLMLLMSGQVIAENCEVRDILGVKIKEELLVIKLLGNEWMQNAFVCQMGEFEIATPTDINHKNTIFIFKKGKPVFYRQHDGTYVYSPKLEDAALEDVMVHIWHGNENEDIKRIWYSTVGKQPRIMVDDINYDGQPDIKKIWKGREISESYKWENNRWLLIESKKPTHNKPVKPTQ